MPGIEGEVNPNVPHSPEHLIKEKFSPRRMVDNKGFSRTIYQHPSPFTNQSVSFSFRGRYELPMWEHTTGGRVDIGSRPVEGIFTPDEYKEYQSEFRTNSNLLAGEKIHYQTTRDIQGFIRLAGLLAPQNEQVRQAVNDVLIVEQGGEYSKSTFDLIEKILAAGVIGDNGKPNAQFDPQAEALVLLSLMQGDDAEEAQILVERKVEMLKQMDNEHLTRELDNYHFAADAESRDISEDFLFHVMSSKPEVENGEVILETVYSSMSSHGTHKQSIIPRDSIHFSFGGPVGAHEGGDWNNKGYIVITKADPTVLKPECTSITAEDTIFEVFPTQKLRLGNAWIVSPTMDASSISNNSFFHLDRENNRALYAHAEDITYGQLEQLFNEQQLKNFNLRSKQNIKITEANIASSLYGSVEGGRLFQGSSREVMGFVREMMSKIKVNFQNLKLPDAIRAAAPDLNDGQVTFFLGALQQHMRDFVAREVVLAMGGTRYEPPMGEGWQDERDGLLAKYAVEHGRVSRNDFRSPEGVLQRSVASSFTSANPRHHLILPDSPSWVNGNVERDTSEDKPGENLFLWERFSPKITSENLLRVSRQQRATIYDAGVLNAR